MILKILSLISALIFLFSCRASQGIGGEYQKSSKDYTYNLIIDSDGSFLFTRQSYHSRSSCEGNWQLNENRLLLQCNEQPIEVQLSSGYWPERDGVGCVERRKAKIR